MTEPTYELETYLAGTADEQQVRAVEAWIHAAPENARAFIAQLHFRELLREHLRHRSDRASVVLAELAHMEATAEVVAFPSVIEADGLTQEHDAGSLSTYDLAAIGKYALRIALTSKPALRVYRYAAAAAVILLVGTLFLYWSSSGDSPTPPMTHQQQVPQDEGQAAVIHVATLTAEHDAQWGRGVVEAGSPLHAGQSLTLTQGLAQITTLAGAVVTLEAPSTIELINTNAIRLVAGKLVGVCETETSKGFLVRTPYMDVTDLGTRFGVDAPNQASAEVHVFEGEVQASLLTAASVHATPRLLTVGQAARVQAGDDQLIDIESDTARFAAMQIGDALPPEAAQAGVVKMAGAVQWLTRRAGPIAVRFDLPKGEDVYVLSEQRHHTLASDLLLSLSETGTSRRFDDLPQTTVPAGTVIRTYFVYLNSGKDGGWIEATGSVSFEGEVLGLISSRPTWEAFQESLESQAGTFFSFEREDLAPNLEHEGWGGADEIFISEDRHTLSFKLTGTEFAEFFRVVVREPILEKSQ